jgi:hypothetical protein
MVLKATPLQFLKGKKMQEHAEATMIRRAVVELNLEGKKEFVCYVKHEMFSLHQCSEIAFTANNLSVGSAIYIFAPKEESGLNVSAILRR